MHENVQAKKNELIEYWHELVSCSSLLFIGILREVTANNLVFVAVLTKVTIYTMFSIMKRGFKHLNMPVLPLFFN